MGLKARPTVSYVHTRQLDYESQTSRKLFLNSTFLFIQIFLPRFQNSVSKFLDLLLHNVAEDVDEKSVLSNCKQHCIERFACFLTETELNTFVSTKISTECFKGVYPFLDVDHQPPFSPCISV